MASPTAPTLLSIAQEGIDKANAPNKVARARDQWMEELKNRVWSRGKKLKSLQTEGVITLSKGRNAYSLPTDLSSILSMVILYGATTGVAQTGAAGTITLASDDVSTEDVLLGKELIITSGTGAEQKVVQITAFDSSTKVATIYSNFVTTPDNTSVYMVVTNYYPLKEGAIWDFDKELAPTTLQRPTHYCPVGDDDDGEIRLFKTPNQLYGLRVRYYADLMELDTTGALMNTLYKRWRNYFVQGVYVAALNENDDRASLRKSPFEAHKLEKLYAELLARETYGMDMSELQIVVND